MIKLIKMKKEKKKRSHQVFEILTNAKLSEGKEIYEEMKERYEGKELSSGFH